MKIYVRAKTNAREDRVEKIDNTHYIVSTNELPINSRANLAIINLIADYFDLPKTFVSISRGLSSKNKIIEISK